MNNKTLHAYEKRRSRKKTLISWIKRKGERIAFEHYLTFFSNVDGGL